MGIEFTVEQREQYTVVRTEGEPDLDAFVSFVQQIGIQSRDWHQGRLLVDLRSIRSLKAFTEHYAIGEAVGRHLGHLQRVASVVPGDRLTRASEKTAKRAGVNLTVFTSEGEAIAWLASEQP